MLLANTRHLALTTLLSLLPVVSLSAASVDYRWPGVHIKSTGFTADIKIRGQFRITSTEIDDPVFPDTDESTEQGFNRARFKIGGKLGAEWIEYYSEYDFPSSYLLDLRLALKSEQGLANIRIGQWKAPYNRERIDSSGKQQFVDRSIANKWFTLDRQRGVSLFGRIGAMSRTDFSYQIAFLEGSGRNGEGSAKSPMVSGRWEWNFLGREVGFSQSDVNKRDQPAGSITFGAARFEGPYTAFSSSGGGQLPGFQSGTKDSYKIRQFMLESAYQYSGFSWQQEYHYKKILDKIMAKTTNVQGGYFQAGYFLHEHFERVPGPLEIALRYAFVDPDTSINGNNQYEIGMIFNWFFAGHDNKVSFDISQFRGEQGISGVRKQMAARLQWDFHI